MPRKRKPTPTDVPEAVLDYFSAPARVMTPGDTDARRVGSAPRRAFFAPTWLLKLLSKCWFRAPDESSHRIPCEITSRDGQSPGLIHHALSVQAEGVHVVIASRQRSAANWSRQFHSAAPIHNRLLPGNVHESEHPVVQSVRAVHAGHQVATRLQKPVGNELPVGRRSSRDRAAVEKLSCSHRH